MKQKENRGASKLPPSVRDIMPSTTTIALNKDVERPPRVLPHTPEAGDPYYFGDCYDRPDVANEWEIDA
jgi:hypothetical protein